MFNIGAGEIVLVLVVAFVIVGPDDLPKVARWLGRRVRRLRSLIRDIKAETGLDELERDVKDAQRDVTAMVRELDITAEIKDAAKDAIGEIEGISKGVEQNIKQIDRDVKHGFNQIRSAADEPGKAGEKSEKQTARRKNNSEEEAS